MGKCSKNSSERDKYFCCFGSNPIQYSVIYRHNKITQRRHNLCLSVITCCFNTVQLIAESCFSITDEMLLKLQSEYNRL